jgi:pyridoxamine 5'-phosphate oxidase
MSCVISEPAGELLEDIIHLESKFQELEEEFRNKPVPRPENWGGYYIVPVRIEFLKFKKSRFHERVLYKRKDEDWTRELLQP